MCFQIMCEFRINYIIIISNPQNMDKKDELLEMPDVTSHSDVSEDTKHEVSPKLIDAHYERLATQCLRVY